MIGQQLFDQERDDYRFPGAGSHRNEWIAAAVAPKGEQLVQGFFLVTPQSQHEMPKKVGSRCHRLSTPATRVVITVAVATARCHLASPGLVLRPKEAKLLPNQNRQVA